MSATDLQVLCVDPGIEAFATLSDGARIFNPSWYHKAERALKTAQRHVSRRKKGSARRRKAVHAGRGASAFITRRRSRSCVPAM